MLSSEQLLAATHTALGLSAAKTAEKLSVCSRTVERWRQNPEFAALVAEERDRIRKQIRSTGAAVKEKRIQNKKGRLRDLDKIRASRAGNPECGGAAWDTTGFMVQRQVMIGSGELALLTTEFELDTGMLRAYDNLEDGIMEEMGEKETKVGFRGSVGIHRDDSPKAPPDRVVELAAFLGKEELDRIIAAAKTLEPNADPEPGDSEPGGIDPGPETT